MKYLTAEEIRQLPTKELTIGYPKVTFDEILARLFVEIKSRQEAGCSTMGTNFLNPFLHWGEYPDPEEAGMRVVEKLKELGFNVQSYHVNRDFPDEYEGDDEKLKELGEVISFHITFDWKKKWFGYFR